MFFVNSAVCADRKEWSAKKLLKKPSQVSMGTPSGSYRYSHFFVELNEIVRLHDGNEKLKFTTKAERTFLRVKSQQLGFPFVFEKKHFVLSSLFCWISYLLMKWVKKKNLEVELHSFGFC